MSCSAFGCVNGGAADGRSVSAIVFESIPVEYLTGHLPWLAGAACICAYLGAQHLCNDFVRRQKILSTGSPIPGWVSYLSLVGFVGSMACGIWSFTISWWAPIPVLVAPFLLRPLVPSDNFNAWLRMVHHFKKAEGSEFQRLCVATAMSALEDRTLLHTVRQLSSADQLAFMMAYECAMMWCLKRGIARA